MKQLDTLKILTGQDAIDAVRALNDENRRQILHALRARRMSTSDLCDFLSHRDPERELKPQTVRYHIKELEKCGLVEQDGYEPAGNGDTHIMKKLWRATAESIFIATGDMDSLPARETYDLDKTLDIIGTMRELGLELNEEEMKAIANAFVEREKIYIKGRTKVQESLEEVCSIDPMLYVVFRKFLSLVRLNNQDYEQYWEISRYIADKLRDGYRHGKGDNPHVY
jgi:DNA-binding transcriptional ArsR family regulator